MMSARAISVILYTAVCSSAIFGNIKANKTEVTSTTESSKTLITTEYLPLSPNTTGSNVEETPLHPNMNSSVNTASNNENTTTLYSPKLSHVTTPKSNQSSLNMSSLTSTVTVTTTLFSSVTVPVTRQISSTDSKEDNSTTAITTNGYSQNSETVTYPMEANTTLLAGTNSYILKYSETILTSVFSTILIVVTLTILAFSLKKYKRQRSQYSHHPLHESSYESANGFSSPDDTLVISGGLYDAPRIYNPNMTVLEEEESHHDYVSFSSRPGQYRLEFLPDDKEIDPAFNCSLRNV
ncbi:uncharacterized protein LOC135051178 [Pseudophryne corroboree]|uniref:uncharacterized protein LOC135051178 n=1 Tax=Pseudophryne corroboree TaxID=495146 RepID=UPI0030817F44